MPDLFSKFAAEFDGPLSTDQTYLARPSGSDGRLTLANFVAAGLAGLRVLFLSRLPGVFADASLSDPTLGHDDSAAVQAGLDAAGPGYLVVVDGAFRLGNVGIWSGCTVTDLGAGTTWYGTGAAPTVGIIQAAGTQCALRNKHWISPYNGGTPVTDYSTIVDHDIRIESLFVNGNRGTGGVNNAAGGAADSRFLDNDTYNAPGKIGITPLIFFGVRRLRVGSLFVYDPDTMAVLGAYLDDFTFDGVRVVAPAVYTSRLTPETISIHAMSGSSPLGGNIFGAVALSGNVNSGWINNVSGYFDGSMVAIQTDWIGDQSYGQNIAAYHPILYPGPATNIQITNIRANLAAAFVCLWSGGQNGGVHYTSLIDRVSCNGVAGTSFQGFIFLDGPASQIGTHGTESFNNLSVRLRCGVYGFMPIWVEGTHVDLRFINIRFSVDAASVAGVTGFAVGAVWVNSTSIDELTIDGLSIYDAVTSLVYDGVYLSGFQAATIGVLTITNTKFYRTSVVTGALLNDQSAAWVANAIIDNCYVKNVANAVKYKLDANALGITGLTHIGAGGAPSVSVSTGKTLAILRASGLNTVLLVGGGGTVISKKTDGTEDA